MARKPDPGSPFGGVDAYSLEDVGAIQALYAGTANAGQQSRALKYVIETLAGTYDQSFRPDSERASAFAEGRRFVGLQLVKLVRLNAQLLREKHGRANTRDPSRDPNTELNSAGSSEHAGKG